MELKIFNRELTQNYKGTIKYKGFTFTYEVTFQLNTELTVIKTDVKLNYPKEAEEFSSIVNIYLKDRLINEFYKTFTR